MIRRLDSWLGLPDGSAMAEKNRLRAGPEAVGSWSGAKDGEVQRGNGKAMLLALASTRRAPLKRWTQ
jgi:hypothetical protein